MCRVGVLAERQDRRMLEQEQAIADRPGRPRIDELLLQGVRRAVVHPTKPDGFEGSGGAGFGGRRAVFDEGGLHARTIAGAPFRAVFRAFAAARGGSPAHWVIGTAAVRRPGWCTRSKFALPYAGSPSQASRGSPHRPCPTFVSVRARPSLIRSLPERQPWTCPSPSRFGARTRRRHWSRPSRPSADPEEPERTIVMTLAPIAARSRQ